MIPEFPFEDGDVTSLLDNEDCNGLLETQKDLRKDAKVQAKAKAKGKAKAKAKGSKKQEDPGAEDERNRNPSDTEHLDEPAAAVAALNH